VCSSDLQPGEYHVFINKDLSNSIVTSLFNPTNNTLSGEFKLYPNPVSAGSKLTYEINKSGEVKIDIIDQKGSKVAQLYRGIKRPGKHEIILESHTTQKLRGIQGPYRISIKTAYGQKTVQFLL
jgi:hypothetical protein